VTVLPVKGTPDGGAEDCDSKNEPENTAQKAVRLIPRPAAIGTAQIAGRYSVCAVPKPTIPPLADLLPAHTARCSYQSRVSSYTVRCVDHARA
jgi:hypothetical protein